MKAIILAAGIGSRLKPITGRKPKTLVEVNGKPMLGYLIDNLKQNGVSEIIVCIGYKWELIVEYCNKTYPELNIHYVKNLDFMTTNNMYTLYLNKEFMDDDTIIMNADLVYDPEVIEGLIKQETSSIPVDRSCYIEESMKILVKDGIVSGISKKFTEEEAYGCSIDVYLIKKDEIKLIVEEMHRIIEVEKDMNQWTEVMLHNLFASGKLKAKPFDISGMKWFEIDDFDDLAEAEILFNDKVKDLKEKKIFFFDRDGTVFNEDKLIDASKEFIDVLDKKTLYYLSNNSSKTPEILLSKLSGLGLDCSKENILISTMPAIEHLKEYGEVFWLANKEVSKFISESGLNFNDKDPKALLLTYDNELTYDKLTKLISFIRKGIPFFATHIDKVCPTEDGPIPDIGSFLQLIETSTGEIPIKTFGKPNSEMLTSTLNKHNFEEKDAVIIGDRLYTDIALAANSDITSILVLTGETSRADYEDSKIRADIVVKDLSVLKNLFQSDNDQSQESQQE